MNPNAPDDAQAFLESAFGSSQPVSDLNGALAARRRLRHLLPEVGEWVCWTVGFGAVQSALRAFVGEGIRTDGRFGGWSWERVPADRDIVHFWSGDTTLPDLGGGWIGLLRIRGPAGEQFYLHAHSLFSGEQGGEYLVSTGDLRLLQRFAADVAAHVLGFHRQSETHIRVQVMGGEDMDIPLATEPKIYLPPGLLEDIETQVDGFFANGDLYRRLQVPHRRGFLFAGAPGTGKTMMLRHLVRRCHTAHGAQCRALTINARTCQSQLEAFFSGGTAEYPVLLLIEDIESLVRETRVTRSALLAQLDGLEARTGTLVIATANRPEQIDPALIHRPSRFDRVWRFPLPSPAIREQYLADAFPHFPRDLMARYARKTTHWTIPYLKELRLTAGMLSLQRGESQVSEPALSAAFRLLRAQFNAAQEDHPLKDESNGGTMGFAPGTEEFAY